MERKYIILPIVLIFILAIAGMADAACTVRSPGTTTIMTGAKVKFNVSVSAATYTNCTATGTSSASGGSWTIGTLLGSAGGTASNTALYANLTTTSVNQRDASDWVFTFTCKNMTLGTTETCTATARTIDNSRPTISAYLIEGVTATNATLTESQFDYDATVKNATSCSSVWKGSTKVMNTNTEYTSCIYATATDSYAAAGEPVDCTFYSAGSSAEAVYVTCTDGRNTTTATLYYVHTEGPVDGGTNPNANIFTNISAWTQTNINQKTVFIFVLLGGALLLVLASFMIAGKKRK